MPRIKSIAVLVSLVAITSLASDAFARGRYFNPRMARFMQRDPVGTAYAPPMARNLSSGMFTQPDSPAQYGDGMSLYEYVRSRPTRFVDPFGLQSLGAGDDLGRRLFGGEPEKLCCGNALYDPKEQCCEEETVVNKVPVFAVNRGGPNQQPSRPGLPRWTGGHIDLVIPGCGMVGFYGGGDGGGSGQRCGCGLEGYFLNTPQEWFQGVGPNLPGRPHYGVGPGVTLPDGSTIPGVLSRICMLKVCPADAKKMCDRFAELRTNPGEFNIIGRNCSTIASQIVGAGGIGSGHIPGIDNPLALMQMFEDSGAQCFNGYTSLFDPDGTIRGNIHVQIPGGQPNAPY
ncbi:MAG: hypothetical protein GX591_19625 [Planctomycetes bacterium]|nr:hypothetical protein [Planctomycetota bacterium]